MLVRKFRIFVSAVFTRSDSAIVLECRIELSIFFRFDCKKWELHDHSIIYNLN